MPAGTLMSIPPKHQKPEISTTGASKTASRRSRSMPPNKARACVFRRTRHLPVRVTPPKTAISFSDPAWLADGSIVISLVAGAAAARSTPGCR